MRTKLASIFAALAAFLAVTAGGAALAGAEPLSESTAVSPTTTTALPSLQAPACSNGIDDDGDGLLDMEDPDCESPEDTTEMPPAAPPAEPTEGEAVPGPTPSPAPTPESSGGSGGGVKQGSEIGGSPSGGGEKGAQRNDEIAAPGTSSSGGTSAPGANGGGDQPLPKGEGSNGGAQFTEGGAPTLVNPTTTIAPFGPAPIGVPNFVIDSFEIPPFLLPIYQACGTEYGIPWEVLASINKIETGFGTNLNVSSAGAVGWMQFLPASWEQFGLDANGDGKKDPYNPVDAICAAANYLDLSGGSENLYDAIFAYNHADWYVQEVLTYARAYGKLPADLVGSLTGLTEGAHFPVAADASYADDLAAREALKRDTPGSEDAYGGASEVISSSPTPRGINIFAAEGAPVVAVNDGVIEKMGESEELGRFIVLQDAYGNHYTYAELGRIVREDRTVVMPTGKERRLPVDSENLRPRLPALPGRVEGEQEDAPVQEIDSAGSDDGTLKVGSKVIAGTVLARIGDTGDGVDPHVNFAIRPAGRGAPQIDPKPILDGWKLLEATAIYRAEGKNPFATKLSSAGVLLLSKEALQRRVLADEQIELPECDRIEVRGGQIDRRLLATLAYLSERGFRLTVTSMLCGRHGSITTSGNISNHSFGNAVDIAAINGVPVLGNQGPGTITEALLKAVLRLQGTMVPDELISLQALGGPSFAMADHADHVHIGWSPLGGVGKAQFVELLKPGQWQRLTERLGEIENPEVATSPSPYSVPDEKPTQGDGGTGQAGGD
ncbi:MAG TPA: lytic murein transglycosylase [Solirubrobacterales bacterium]|nr:lytic murein transglycosylase [Solirubrobacterales bacterium]